MIVPDGDASMTGAAAWLAGQGVAPWPAGIEAVENAWRAAMPPSPALFDVPAARFDRLVERR